MASQVQQYPTINCKKVTKIKTTTLQMFQKEDKKESSFQKIQREGNRNSLERKNTVIPKSNFEYLDGPSSIPTNSKSFEQLINESRKVLKEKQKIEQNHRKILREKAAIIKPKQSKKQQKSQKKQKKKSKKVQKQTKVQQEILLSDLDIQKFATQDQSIGKVIQKIKFVESLSAKCNIISPLLFSLKNEEKTVQPDQRQSMAQAEHHQNRFDKESLADLGKLGIEIKLLKRNFQESITSKGLLTVWQIQQFSEWEAQNLQGIKNDLLCEFVDKRYIKTAVKLLQDGLEQMEALLSQVQPIQ